MSVNDVMNDIESDIEATKDIKDLDFTNIASKWRLLSDSAK